MSTHIAAIGMVSALGLDWATSCAASRCGVSRAAALDHYRVQAGDPWKVEFVVGHQVDLLTRGFERHGRLLRLLTGALRDLLRTTSETARDYDSAPVYLSLPDPHRTLSDAVLDEKTGAEAPVRRSETSPSQGFDAAALLSQAATLAGWPCRIRLAAAAHSGHTGTIDILERCLRDLSAGQTSYAIVGAVDSLLDDETLAWLSNTRRLKNPSFATGMVPGESGVVLLLCQGQQMKGHLGTIDRLAFDHEDQSFDSGKAPLGKGLSSVVRQVADGTDWPGQSSPWVLSDHNGEVYRANDWGWALQRLTAANAIFSTSQMWFPASSFGDTGSAGAAVGIACAVAAWKRGYAPSTRCCIAASADSGRRAGLRMSNPQARRG